MTIQSKTFALLERDYMRVHPPGAVVTQAALAWLGEVAETMAKLTETMAKLTETMAKLTEERDAATKEQERLTRKMTEVRHMYAEAAVASVRGAPDPTKRDKLAQRFAAAILTSNIGRVSPERLRELAEQYADVFYPESDR